MIKRKFIPKKVKDLFYVCDNGFVRNKITRNYMAKTGDISGTLSYKGEYREIRMGDYLYKAHRIAWFLHYNEQPPDTIDHIDGNGLNNSKENLRKASFSENSWNSKMNNNNSSGVKGVDWCAIKRKWRVRISINKKRKFLGYFSSLQEASKVVKEARIKYHKEFANEGV